MTTFADVWNPPVGPTSAVRIIRGAGVTTWASVSIENDTGVSIYVAQGDTPPTGQTDAWRVVPPGAFVTLPLSAPAVAMRLAGAVAAGAAVQTVLSTDAAGAGGSTGQVSIASGVVNVTGPVSVQNAAGVNLSVAAAIAGVTTMAINAGTTALSIPLLTNVQRVTLMRGSAIPGGDRLPFIQVVGDTTGTHYFYGYMPILGQISLNIPGLSSGISVDPSVTVSIFASVGGGTLLVVQSYAPPALTANDIFPEEIWSPTAGNAKNLYVVPVPGKLLAQFTSTAVGPNVIVPAPGVNNFLSLRRLVAVPRTIVAGNTFALQYLPGPTNLVVFGSAGVPPAVDFEGWTLAENTGVQVAQAAPLGVWDVTLTYAVTWVS